MPALKDVLADPATVWHSMTVAPWYGAGERQVEWVSGLCVWYHSGLPVVPIRWLLVRDPQGRFDAQAFLSTDLSHTPQQMLQWFIQRWQVEVTFEESRAHLGLETQRQWSDLACRSHHPHVAGPVLTGACDGAAVFGHGRQLPVRAAAWYAKTQPTFCDTLAWVRRWVSQTCGIFCTSKTKIRRHGC